MFRSAKGYTHLFQIVFSKGNAASRSYPMSREFLYEQPAFRENTGASRAA
jgi:cyclopropane-fatty-acyl-phospholipid synthase